MCLGRVAAVDAQARVDVRALATVTAAPETFAGVGAGVARWGRFRTGFGANATVGLRDGHAAARGELWAGYHLNPLRARGWSAYGGAGGALVAGGSDAQGYLTVFLGAERHPAAPRGWFIEVGVGGGPRAVVGYRVSRRGRA